MIAEPDRPATEYVDELLAFLPAFEHPGRRYIRTWRGIDAAASKVSTFPYLIYEEDVVAFFRLAGQHFWSDYDYDPGEAQRMLQDDDTIGAATVPEIRTMLTLCVRGERFSDGYWGHLLKTGLIQALLRRFKAIKAGPQQAG